MGPKDGNEEDKGSSYNYNYNDNGQFHNENQPLGALGQKCKHQMQKQQKKDGNRAQIRQGYRCLRDNVGL
jgi:hypothetical protein